MREDVLREGISLCIAFFRCDMLGRVQSVSHCFAKDIASAWLHALRSHFGYTLLVGDNDKAKEIYKSKVKRRLLAALSFKYQSEKDETLLIEKENIVIDKFIGKGRKDTIARVTLDDVPLTDELRFYLRLDSATKTIWECDDLEPRINSYGEFLLSLSEPQAELRQTNFLNVLQNDSALYISILAIKRLSGALALLGTIPIQDLLTATVSEFEFILPSALVPATKHHENFNHHVLLAGSIKFILLKENISFLSQVRLSFSFVHKNDDLTADDLRSLFARFSWR